MVGICELPAYVVFTHSRWDGRPVELKHKYAVAVLVDQDWKTSAAFNGSAIPRKREEHEKYQAEDSPTIKSSWNAR